MYSQKGLAERTKRQCNIYVCKRLFHWHIIALVICSVLTYLMICKKIFKIQYIYKGMMRETHSLRTEKKTLSLQLI